MESDEAEQRLGFILVNSDQKLKIIAKNKCELNQEKW